ncbi:MAG: HEAT repeat domain-containing protein [Rivularia sp. ALOHA_DT_140]|nr:HEAT repeat domain-containing protein [Rivularia sp. ALOHA_DT_140]
MKSTYLNCLVKYTAINIAKIASYGTASTISVTLLCFLLPLFGITAASAQTTENKNIEQTATASIADAVSTLIQVLRSENIEARVNAARALGGMGLNAKIAEPALTVALYDKEARVRYTAATAIANLGGDTKAALPLLQEALQNESKWTRNDATFALSNVALRMQTKARTLSDKELNQAITDLEKTLEVMRESEYEISPQAIKSISDSLDSLKREKQRGK